MARRNRPNTEWTVNLVPDGTLEEAEAAASRARRIVARWIIRRSRNYKLENWENSEIEVARSAL